MLLLKIIPLKLLPRSNTRKNILKSYITNKPLNRLDRISFNSLVFIMYDPQNPFSHACGYVNNDLAKKLILNIFKSTKSSCTKPLRLISIGTGSGVWEKMIKPLVKSVECYDIFPQDVEGLIIHKKDVTNDSEIKTILPNDCSNCVLFSAYPQGYLTNILAQFNKRNGTRLITVTEESLLSNTHAVYEKNIELFKNTLNEFIGSPSNISRFEVGGNEDLGITFLDCIGSGFSHKALT